MLTESSYFVAMTVYLVMGLMLCVFGARWVARSPGWRLAWFLTAAALLLTPAFPAPGIDTLAPAAIVAGFQLATAGVEPAMHALRPLGIALVIAWLLALVVGGLRWRGRQRR
ncbi:MAG: hypothetical protein ABR578_05040 [Chromatocurvus sp.]